MLRSFQILQAYIARLFHSGVRTWRIPLTNRKTGLSPDVPLTILPRKC